MVDFNFITFIFILFYSQFNIVHIFSHLFNPQDKTKLNNIIYNFYYKLDPIKNVSNRYLYNRLRVYKFICLNEYIFLRTSSCLQLVVECISS